MKFTSVVNVPVFIESYIFADKSGTLEEFTHIFCNDIMNLDFNKYIKNNTIYYEAYITNDISKRFIQFYLEKSQLDHYYDCKYEDEKNISKSISNELFEVEIDNTYIVHIYIDSFENDKLIFAVIK